LHTVVWLSAIASQGPTGRRPIDAEGQMWGQVWSWIAWINSQLRDVVAITTFVVSITTLLGVMYQVWMFRRTTRLVTVIVVNRESQERREIAKVPASFVSRAEVMGLVAQAAGGERLDFAGFAFDYKFHDQVVVELPAESFGKLSAV
jgi:hypothetical protein